MKQFKLIKTLLICLACRLLNSSSGQTSKFGILAFYTVKNDQAHISFVHKANNWFSQLAARIRFTCDSTDNLNILNTEFLRKYQVVLFLDTRPEEFAQRGLFRNTWKTEVHGWDFTSLHLLYHRRVSIKTGTGITINFQVPVPM